MFASWKKARAASLAAAVVGTLGAFAPSAHALEGIQGRHAIFYPSLELVYQHDDNYYLEPQDEHSADTFIAHAHFALEIPGQRQYLRMEYAPQFRSVNVNTRSGEPDFDLDDEWSHFWNLDAKLKASSIFGVDIHQDFTAGSLEGYELDENVGELNRENGEPFWRHDIDVDFKWDGSKQGVKAMLGKEDSKFDDTPEAPAWFELNAWNLGFEYHYRFAPLSNFIAGYMYTDNDQDYTEKAIFSDPTRPEHVSSKENHLWLGVDGELGRTTTGSATVGFQEIDYDEVAGDEADFEGFTLRADLTKSFSRWSKLIFNAERTPNFSAFAQGLGDANYYYISNRASFTFTNQPQGSRIFWTLIGQFQRNGWDVEDGNIGKEREDDMIRLRAEVGFHPLEHLSFRLNYEHKDNDSNDPAYDYVDNLIILQVQFGF